MQRNLGIAAGSGNAGHESFFHHFGIILIGNQGAGDGLDFDRQIRICEAGKDSAGNLELAREFYGADLQHLGTGAREFKHLLKRNTVQTLCFRHNAGVGRIDAIHIREDQALVSVKRCRDRDSGRIRTAAAKRRNVAFGIHTLETCHHNHAAALQLLTDSEIIDRIDAGLHIGVIGVNSNLPSGQAHRIDPDIFQRHREEADRHLLTGCRDDIKFAGIRAGRHFLS